MNRRHSSNDRLLAHSANGVIRVQELERLGLHPGTTYRRCGTDGPWQRLLPGVVVLHDGPVSRLQQVSAALLYGGSLALVTGSEACRRFGLHNVPPDESVHILVPADRKLHSSGFVVVERTTRMPKGLLQDALPLCPPTRAALDLARRMTVLQPCRALLAECVQRRKTTTGRLRAELAHGSQRGSAIPRKVLAEMVPGGHSVAELDAERVRQRTSLPAASWNGRLYDPAGVYVATPDAWFDDVALAWEIDSLDYHLGPESYSRTIDRNARYAAAGVSVLQTLPARLRDEPEIVLRELTAAYAAAAARPRPAVVHHALKDAFVACEATKASFSAHVPAEACGSP